MIDIEKERLLTINQAVKLLPPIRRGKKLHKATVYRWIQRGVKGIKLEAIRIGGTLMTSVEALIRFFERLGNDQPILRERKVDDAEVKLTQYGF